MEIYGKRARSGMALDDIEEMVVKQCVESVKEAVETTDKTQVVLIYKIIGSVEDAARIHNVDFNDLWHETLEMLKDGIYDAIGGFKSEHEYIHPYKEDGYTVGMKVNFYISERRAA